MILSKVSKGMFSGWHALEEGNILEVLRWEELYQTACSKMSTALPARFRNLSREKKQESIVQTPSCTMILITRRVNSSDRAVLLEDFKTKPAGSVLPQYLQSALTSVAVWSYLVQVGFSELSPEVPDPDHTWATFRAHLFQAGTSLFSSPQTLSLFYLCFCSLAVPMLQGGRFLHRPIFKLLDVIQCGPF